MLDLLVESIDCVADVQILIFVFIVESQLYLVIYSCKIGGYLRNFDRGDAVDASEVVYDLCCDLAEIYRRVQIHHIRRLYIEREIRSIALDAISIE